MKPAAEPAPCAPVELAERFQARALGAAVCLSVFLRLQLAAGRAAGG